MRDPVIANESADRPVAKDPAAATKPPPTLSGAQILLEVLQE